MRLKKQLRNILLSFIIITLGLSCSPGKTPPKAVKGILDLRDWEFESPIAGDGIVNLDGEWEFYWKEFLLGDDQFSKQEIKNFIKAPQSWNNYSVSLVSENNETFQEKLDGMGYATYRLKILLNEKIEKISILSNYQATAYQIYCNDAIITNSGIVNQDSSIHSPGKREVLYSECNIKENHILYLTILVSNYSHSEGGLWSSIQIGSQNKILKARQNRLGIGLFVGGVLAIMGIYHFALFILRPEDYSTFYFGLICVCISIRNSVNKTGLLYNFIDSMNFYISLKMEYVSLTLVILFFILYIYSLFPIEFNIKIRNVLLLLSVPSTIITVLFSPLIYTLILDFIQFTILLFSIYGIYIILKSIKRERSSSVIFLVGFVIFVLGIVNDILNNYFIIKTIDTSPIGLVIFIFSQSFLLSSRFSRAFKDVEMLSNSLKTSNLELQVSKERVTKAYLELEASQKQLVQSDKMITLGTMLAGVVHEINTPLGAIKANSENILESLRNLILKLNPSLSHISLEELQNSMKILELSRESTTSFSSKEARALRKKVISLLEERNQSNPEILTDFIIELSLVEALERNEEILAHPQIEKYLSIAGDLHGIRKKSSVIQASAERVSKIVKSLKSFMHFDQNEKKILADLSEGMETVLIILHNKIKLGIEVTKNYEYVPQIYCNPDELNQIWTNLIHNAIQAMDEKGSLQIDIEKISSFNGTFDIDYRNPSYKGDFINVSIQDSGSGIPPEIRKKIFQAFFTTKVAGEGSGLGLHIIGKILEKHEGALFLESEAGRTRFSVLLPIGE